MATETLRPASDTVTGGTVTNPTQGYDGNPATFAEEFQNTTGTSAGWQLYDFSGAAINGANRTTSSLVVSGYSTTVDSGVTIAVFLSVDEGSTWNLVDAQAGDAEWGTGSSPVTRTFDIASVIGSIQVEKVRVAIRVDNNVTDPPTFPS